MATESQLASIGDFLRPALTAFSPLATPSPSAAILSPHVHAVGQGMGSFSCSIPRLFVLSHNMSMVNTRGKLASFWRFSITGFLPSASLTTGHYSLAPRPTPHAYAPRATSGVRSCADCPPLATARHRPPICQKPNGVQSRRTAPLYSVCHRTRRLLRKNQTVLPHSLPPNRRPFSRGQRRSTPVAPGQGLRITIAKLGYMGSVISEQTQTFAV